MVRETQFGLAGEWVPLDDVSLRRGCLLTCETAVSTDNADSYNVTMKKDQFLKVVDVDSDGDAKVVMLESLGCADLLFPSERLWLLSSNFGSFKQWLPASASSEAAEAERVWRRDSQEQ